MPTINEYSRTLPEYNYLPTNYDPTLEIQVLQKSQKNYDRILNTVKGLQSQALNVQMLNQEGRVRLENYNKELNEKLTGDLGDLNKAEVQNEIAGYFQNIANDTQLIKASQLSREYQSQIDTIESFKQSGRKDRGYNSINETVFKEWDGGLYDFMQSGIGRVTDPNFRVTKYTPFKELDTKLVNIAKTLHADTQITEGASGVDGYLLHKEISGVTPEKIREMLATQFDQEDLEQLDVMAKYEVIQNRRLNSIPEFYQKYNQFADNEIKRTQSQSDILTQQADYYQSLINNSKTPADKKAEYIAKVNQLKTNSQLYSNRASSLQQSKKGLEDFEKMSNEELLQYAKEIQWNNKINGLSDALSWKKEVEIYKPDQVWMFNKKMDVLKWQEQVRSSTKLATSRIAREGKEGKQPEFSGVGDPVKNTQSFFETYKNLTDLQQQMAKVSNRIVTSPSFDSSKLLDSQFLKDNKDNYEVKMWDIFQNENPNSIKGNKPQIEQFKLWLKEVESNPQGLAGGYVEQQHRNEVVSDYLDKQVMDINTKTRKGLNQYDNFEYTMYKQDGSILSKDDYDKGIPAYISVPNDNQKSSYRLVKLDEALEEIKRGKQKTRDKLKNENLSLYGGPTSGAGVLSVLSNMIDPEGEGSEYTGYLNSDKGLVQKLNQLVEQEDKVNKQLETEMMNQLPEVFQIGMVEAMNDEAKKIYWNDVFSSAKNANSDKEGQFGLSFEDIDVVRIGLGGDKGQFRLKPGVAEKLKGFKLPDASDPKKLVDIVPGITYGFRTERPFAAYDILYNEAAKTEPIVSNYKGYTIRVAKSQINNNTTIQVYSPSGELIDKKTSDDISDVNAVIKAMRQYIDTIKK